MSIRTVAIVGWALVLVNTSFILFRLVIAQQPTDNAGRGMAFASAVLGAALLLLLAAVLVRSQRPGIAAGVWASTLLLGSGRDVRTHTEMIEVRENAFQGCFPFLPAENVAATLTNPLVKSLLVRGATTTCDTYRACRRHP